MLPSYRCTMNYTTIVDWHPWYYGIPVGDASKPGPTVEDIVEDQSFQVVTRNIRGLEMHLEEVLTAEFSAMLVQEADVDEGRQRFGPEKAMRAGYEGAHHQQGEQALAARRAEANTGLRFPLQMNPPP